MKTNNNPIEKNSKGKKEFDKKKWREQKYSNKYKVNQWQNQRKRRLTRELCQELQQNNSKPGKLFKRKPEREGTKSLGGKSAAQLEYERLKKEKDAKKSAQQKAKEEKEEALRKYKEKKAKAYAKLSRKTKKGQPVMKGRMELLLEKIQQST